MDGIKTINLITMKKQRDFWDYFLFFSMVLGIFLLMVCFFTRTVVNGESMENTLLDGQNLLVERVEYNNVVKIDNGDIVVVESKDFNDLIIKRVIGTPGDTISIQDNVVYLNGVALEEDYIKGEMLTRDMEEITLDDDEYFIMGDNRNNSSDSRRIGPVTEDELFGKVVFDFREFAMMQPPEIFEEFRA